MASTRSKSVLERTSLPKLTIKAPPGVKLSAVYQYEVLPTVAEQGEKALEQRDGPTDVAGMADGSRVTAMSQASSKPVPEARGL